MAAAVPITDKVDGQVSRLATTVVTEVGGIWKLAPAAIADSTWRYFTKPSPPIRAAINNKTMNNRFAICSPNRKSWINGGPQALKRTYPKDIVNIDIANRRKDSGVASSLLAALT